MNATSQGDFVSKILQSIPEPVLSVLVVSSLSEIEWIIYVNACSICWLVKILVFESAAGFVQFWDGAHKGKGSQKSLGQNRKFSSFVSNRETRKWKILGFFFVHFTPEQSSRTAAFNKVPLLKVPLLSCKNHNGSWNFWNLASFDAKSFYPSRKIPKEYRSSYFPVFSCILIFSI